MMFMAANPATASAFISARLSLACALGRASKSGCASKPRRASASINSGTVTAGSCTIVTRLAVKLTRAPAMPGCAVRPFSILAIQPAQCMAGTANSVSTGAAKARSDLSGASVFIADFQCVGTYRCRDERSDAPASARLAVAHR